MDLFLNFLKVATAVAAFLNEIAKFISTALGCIRHSGKKGRQR